MIKNDIVTNKDLSLKLRDIGAKQVSCHSWILNTKINKDYTFFEHSPAFVTLMYSDGKASAYTAEEVLGFLPAKTADGVYTLEILKMADGFEVCYINKDTGEVKYSAKGKHLCDAAGDLLLKGLELRASQKAKKEAC